MCGCRGTHVRGGHSRHYDLSLAAITYPGGTNQATYAYDNANRLSSVTDWNSKATSYAYDDANRMTTTTLPSGTGVVSVGKAVIPR